MKKFIKSSKRICKSRPVMAGESYGWVVEPYEAAEAYEFACEHLGTEYVNEEIIQCISSDELSECLAYIFRMNDFDEWYDREQESDD